MSEFSVRATRIRAIEPIPDADRIELAVVGDYRCVTQKGRFTPGDLAVYIPEASILPGQLLKYLDMEGRLAGPNHDRVKAVRLRGCLSQGILLRPDEVTDYVAKDFSDFVTDEPIREGDDLAAMMSITKWEPVIPAHMNGLVVPRFGDTVKYDIENYKAYPDVFREGETVEFTEKLHGTCVGITYMVDVDDFALVGRNTLIYSKGYGGQGLCFSDTEENKDNLYVRTVKDMDIPGRMARVFKNDHSHITLFGEIHGPGVQDLHYGLKNPTLSVFDIYVGKPARGLFLSRRYLDNALQLLGIPRVPVLYRGPFSYDVMMEHTTGKTIQGDGSHIREGIVVTPEWERHEEPLGRVILKSVSPDYLMRKGNQTEYN